MSDDDRLIDYNEAERLTAIRRGTLASMVCRKQIPHVRVAPRIVRFRIGDLRAWLADRSVPMGGVL